MLLLAIAISGAAAVYGLFKLSRELRDGAILIFGVRPVTRVGRPILYWAAVFGWIAAYIVWLFAVSLLLPTALARFV